MKDGETENMRRCVFISGGVHAMGHVVMVHLISLARAAAICSTNISCWIDLHGESNGSRFGWIYQVFGMLGRGRGGRLRVATELAQIDILLKNQDVGGSSQRVKPLHKMWSFFWRRGQLVLVIAPEERKCVARCSRGGASFHSKDGLVGGLLQLGRV